MWDNSFQGNRRDLVTNNLQNIMLHILRPLAAFLVTKTHQSGDNTWQLAPFFNFFEFTATPSFHEQLKTQFQSASQGNSELASLRPFVDGLIAV